MKIQFIVCSLFAILLTGFHGQVKAQEGGFANPVFTNYRVKPAKINDLVHTRLDVRFDYAKCYLNGREWITLKPHFYPTDTLSLDAKGMDINKIAVVKSGKLIPLTFSYDSLALKIRLDKVYRRDEAYTVYIDYTAKPNSRKGIRENEKGLYFINPDGSEKNKPTQIWTEGEPESSSGWFPTIDKPDQKTTEEISMTIPAKYVTLSNGYLASQKDNHDGTRTDTWKMNLPNAPYLFMMAVGDFKIYHDHWRNKEVNYYLEPKYAPYAREIFGQTPEAMEFFSKTTGVDFPWDKEAEIIVRDYISGAMENTSATVFGEPVQGSYRELADQYFDPGIEHELFHQWFGDYVTAASWSNLTLNESFADFGEIIWLEHKYGSDAAGEHVYNGLQGYLNNPANFTRPLVDFNYKIIKDVFNGVTYQKGGRILYMLRNYLGNQAFYKALHIYLTTYALKNAEAQQLRLAMEEASGLDLNWFFNQWYYGAGHPVLNISYNWDDADKTEKVFIEQKQSGAAFILPVAVDIYAGGIKERHKVWLRNQADTLIFHLAAKPDLVNVDADKMLVAQKTDNKTMAEYAFQFFHAPLYLDRYEAFDFATKHRDDKEAQKIIKAALNDPFPGLRTQAIKALDFANMDMRQSTEPLLAALVKGEKNNLTRAAALEALAKYKDTTNLPLFVAALNSESYTVQAAALFAVNETDAAKALLLVKGFEADNEGGLTQVIFGIYAHDGNASNWPFIYKRFTGGSLQEQIHLCSKFAQMVGNMSNKEDVKQGIAELKYLAIKYRPEGAAPYISKFLQQIKEVKEKKNDSESARVASEAMDEIKGEGSKAKG